MAQSDDDSTRARVLDLIAEKGPVLAAQLVKALSLTLATMRRHITTLEDAEQIEVRTPTQTGKRGRGRPARHYVLTPKARTSFAEGYSDLVNRALRYLPQVAGDKAVDFFAAARGRDLERRYVIVVEVAGKDLSERIRTLANALTLDGCAASVHDVGDGSFAVQLCQGNCPVRDVAGEFHELCDTETQAISRLVGVPVQRLATLAGGEHVHITHIPIATPALRKRAVRVAAKTQGLETKRTEGTR